MKYLWLIDVLKSHGKMTLEQINEEWKNCYLNETKKDIPLRTFHNYVDAIQDIFKFITITCDRKDGYTYRIEENNYYQGKQTLNLLSSLFLNLKTASNKRLKNKVCDFDLLNAATPKVMDNLLEAIEKNKIVTLWKVYNLDPAIRVENDDEIKIFGKSEMMTELSGYLMNAGILVSELSVKEITLEDYFMSITGGEKDV